MEKIEIHEFLTVLEGTMIDTFILCAIIVCLLAVMGVLAEVYVLWRTRPQKRRYGRRGRGYRY